MSPRQTVTSAASAALDALYTKAFGATLKRIESLSKSRTSKMQASLKKLDDEAKRLKDDKKRMAADNPQLLETIGDYHDFLNETAALIDNHGNALQESGVELAIVAVTAKVFASLSDQMIASGVSPVSTKALSFYRLQVEPLGFVFPSSLDFARNYVDSAAWVSRLDKWGAGYAQLSRDSILKGIQNGMGPRAVASQMRQYAEGIPKSAAESLTRTLQLTSYREASLAMEKVNGDFIEYKIRWAELDSVTCLSCVALHGTRLEAGERVDDHYNGRCTELYVVPGGGLPEFMQADSTPGNRNFVQFQTGPEWFASLSPERQAAQASFKNSPAKLAAFRSGVELQEFVGEHVDDIFGRQVVESSLVQAVGQAAAEGFYT
jgi:hypothetical protein